VLRHRDELDARVVVISFAIPEMLRLYRDELALGDVRLLSDVERAAYAAFGFGRAAAARVWLDPRVWWTYVGLLARGRRPQPPQDDTLQLGGDVLVDRGGRIRWIHRSRGPEDRPSLDALLAARRAA
jgi:hypothetical protein